MTTETEAASPIPFDAAQEVSRLDIAQRHEQSLAFLAPHRETGLKPKHAQLLFSNVVKTNPANEQQMKGACLNCNMQVSSTGGGRFAAHLLACPMVPADVKRTFKVLQVEKEKKSSAKRDALTLAGEEAELAAQEHTAQQVTLKRQCIGAGIKSAEAAAADAAIADFFYANAIGFSVASSESTSLYRTMVRAIQNAPRGYVPPNEKKLGGTLLDEGYQRMWRKMEARDPDGVLKDKFGSTYVSDGWDSCDHLPLINS